jgi:hypothetical protein
MDWGSLKHVEAWARTILSGGGGETAVSSVEFDMPTRRVQVSPEQTFSSTPVSIVSSGSPSDNSGASSEGAYSFIKGSQWNMDMVGARELWATYSTRGEGSVIAVLDSGMGGGAGGAFQGRIVRGYDFVSDEEWSKDGDGRDPDPTDPGDSSSVYCPESGDSWHGTAVASVASASYKGFEGVAPAANVMPVRVLGMCVTGYASDVADGIVWAAGGIIDGVESAVDDNDANSTSVHRRIILMSLSGEGPCPSYMQTAVDLAVRNGVGVFAAAGNDPMLNASNQFPANCRGAVSVGAWNWKKEEAFYSSKNPSIFMPGGDNEKSIPVLINNLQSGVWGMMGTSFAAPHAAGLCAIFDCISGTAYAHVPSSTEVETIVAPDEGLVRAANFVTSSPAVSVQPVTGVSNTFFMQFVAGSYSVTLTKTQPYQVFMIGGGGGAGQDHSGGAGAGAHFFSASMVLQAGTYTFTVGAGGVGEPGTNSDTIEPTAGGDTLISIGGNNVLRVRGGARGSTWETREGAAMDGGCGAGTLNNMCF